LNEQIEGINWVSEALKAGRQIHRIYVDDSRKDRRVESILAHAHKRGIPVESVGKNQLRSMSASGSPQGVVALASPYHYWPIEDILEFTQSRGEQPFLILLDGVEDPQNLGAIIRTAECAGVHGIVLPLHHSVKVTPAVGRASAGAVEHMKIALVTNLVRAIEELKQGGLWIVGADAMANHTYFEVSLAAPLALVFGGEGRGIRRLVREHCDILVSIPMFGQLNSLNVSTACALVTFEVLRQRYQDGGVKG